MKWFLKNFEEIISGTALVIVLAIVIFNVFMRYIFSISFNWAEEIATMGFVWTVFLGASACYKRGMHIGIDVIIHFILNSLARLMELGTGILLIVANAYLTYLSWVFSIAAWIKPTTALLIPYTFVDISSMIAFGLMTFHSVAHFINVLKGAKPQGNEEGIILEI